jgi:hypothetical protein
MTTITSPAGDLIEVVDDADFMEVFDTNEIDLRIWEPKRPIFAALWYEGAVVDRKSGLAARKLWERAGRYGYPSKASAIVSVMNSPMMRSCLEREVNVKRTYSIKLVRLPASYVERLKRTKAKAPPRPKEEEEVVEPGLGPEPEPEQAAMQGNTAISPPTVEPVPELIEDAAAAVARELLAEVVRIVTKRPEPLEAPELKERLSNALTHGEKMRRDLRETGEELAAVKLERDSLRQKLRLSEANLQKAIGTSGREFILAEVNRQVRNIMEAKPTAKGNDEQ